MKDFLKAFGIYGLAATILIIIVLAIFRDCSSNNNYEAVTTGTTHTLTDNNKMVSSAMKLVFSRDQIINAKDAMIKDLLELNSELEIKLRKTESLLKGKIVVTGKGETIVYHDTVYSTEFLDMIEYIMESDTFNNNYLYFTRAKDSRTDKAIYNYTYSTDVLANVNWYKDGKWKPINLFKWRSKKVKVDIIGEDPNMVIDSIIFIEVR